MGDKSQNAADKVLTPQVEGLRYAKLGYIALRVTDVHRSRHFYESVMGLEVSDVGAGGEVYLRCSNDHHNIVLYPDADAGLKRICWQVEDELQLPKVAALARRLKLPIAEVPAAECDDLRQGKSYRLVDPFTGACMEFTVARDSGLSFTPTVARIQRLGHVVLTTDQYADAVKFYTEDLNFRISDAIGSRIAFMRCFPNPYHHSFAIANGAGCGFHHLNFMVNDIDDIGKAFWRFQNNNVPIVYGPGRHPPSDSVFLYANDPDGITVEYSFGMEEFPENAPRPPRSLPQTRESADTWGAPPPRIQTIPIDRQLARSN